MAEIRHLENRHEVIFTPVGGPILIKFRRLVQNDMSTPVMWSKSKPDVEFQYSGRLCEFHGMSSQPPASLQGTATWRIQCHDPRAMCHITGCCHQADSMACHLSHLLHCRVLPPGEFSVMIPELCVTLQGAATGLIQWHVIPEPRITLQGAATW